MVAMGAMEGTVQEGSIPTWMEVVFVSPGQEQGEVPGPVWID